MNRLNKTKSAVFLYCRCSLFLKDYFFPDYLQVPTAVIVACGVGKNYSGTSVYSVDIFHILVFQEYWVLMENRILLKPVLGA